MRSKLPFVAGFLIVTAFYVWTAASTGTDLHWGSAQHDYYNLLVDGFRKGRLSLDAVVPPALNEAANPYDPAQRPEGVGLHDASLYRGRYYIYYGVVPAVVLMLPFRAVTGFGLPIKLAVLAFSLGALGVMLALLADVRRRVFPRVGNAMAVLIATGVGLASCLPLLIRRGSMYELPIASGAFFALVAAGALYRGAFESKVTVRWLALASLALGLAVGCRPTYVIPAAILLPGAAWAWTRQRSEHGDSALHVWAAALIPAAIVGLGLGAYNLARFGNATEFGLRYILSGVYEAKIEHFRLRYVPWNAFAYLFAPVGWGRYFPFVHELPVLLPRPAQHYGIDHAFGLLVCVPFLWLAGSAGLSLSRQVNADVPASRALFRLVFALGVLAVTMGGILLLFYAAMARYLGDFAPALATLAGIGACGALDATASRRGARLFRAAVAVLAAVSMFAVIFFSIQLYGDMQADNPAGYATLARRFDAPFHAVEAFAGTPTGAVVLRLRLPGAATGRDEELLRTGFPVKTDRVGVTYPDSGHLRFWYEHAGAPVCRSDAISVDPRREHIVLISLGSLLPPETWPGYEKWGAVTARAVAQRVYVSIDGKTALDRHQRFYAGGRLAVGGIGTEAPFRGTVVAVTRETVTATRDRFLALPLEPAAPKPDSDGVWRLHIAFPDGPPRVRAPLVVTGETERGNCLGVEFLSGHRLRLVFDEWGKRTLMSDAIAYEPGRADLVEVEHPAYRNGGGPGELVVRLNGVMVWRTFADFYRFGPDDVYLGSDPIGGSWPAAFAGTMTQD